MYMIELDTTSKYISSIFSIDILNCAFCMQVYVHPVLPVLNETRQMVLKYNEIYHKKITEEVPGILNVLISSPLLCTDYSPGYELLSWQPTHDLTFLLYSIFFYFKALFGLTL